MKWPLKDARGIAVTVTQFSEAIQSHMNWSQQNLPQPGFYTPVQLGDVNVEWQKNEKEINGELKTYYDVIRAY